ncbi:hypothetical protein CP532_3254 [Ophiocordyceps camponoti-leonardi (nom. inval.)]|nr:hypothetical protein CP532_3254 [Ophiocordyceps camponoti-leonardi (nom. inval.)]
MPPTHRDITDSIKSVQASAASLHDRTQFAGAAFTRVARDLSELHDAIRRLRVAAEGPSILPRGPASHLLLTSLVMNCDMSLSQLADMLEKHPSAKTETEKSMVSFLGSKLVRQRVDIDVFLATSQKEYFYSGTAAIPAPSSIEPELWQCFFAELHDEDSAGNISRATSPFDDEAKQWHFISTEDILRSDRSQDSRSTTARLQPDSSGREISPDATWTRLDRRLISVQVLEEAGLRYEARHDSVSVLGTLSASQIRELAERSAEVRQGRSTFNSPHPSCSRSPTVEAEKRETPFKLGLEDADRDAQRRRDRRGRVNARHHRHRHRSRSCHGNRTAKKEAIRMRDVLGVIGSIASVISLAKEFA